MKKILLSLFVFWAFTSNAQIGQGHLFLGGSLGLSSSNGKTITVVGSTTTEVENTSTLGFEILPEIGYMLTENIGAGLGIGYDFTKTTIPDFFDNGTDLFDQVQKTGTFEVLPFFRYYVNASSKLYLFGQLSFPIGFGSYKDLMWNNNFDGVVDNDVKNTNVSFGTGIGLGADLFVSENVALEANLNLFGFNFINTSSTVEQPNGDKVTQKSSGFIMDLDTRNLIDFSSFVIGIKIFL